MSENAGEMTKGPAATTGAPPQTATIAGTPAAQPPVDAKPQGAAAPQVPVKYDLKLPDDALVGADWMERTVALARERGLSAEQAQAVLEHGNSAVMHYQDAQSAATKSIVDGWAKEAENDKEIGGPAFAKNVEYAKRVVDRFGTDAFRAALNDSGLGNHPELLRVFSRIGRLIAEDATVLGGGRPSAPPKSQAEVLYGGPKQ
jgi:hypothetical protein